MTKVDAILEKAGGGSAQTIVEALGVYADKDFSGYTIEEAIRELPAGGGGGFDSKGTVSIYVNGSKFSGVMACVSSETHEGSANPDDTKILAAFPLPSTGYLQVPGGMYLIMSTSMMMTRYTVTDPDGVTEEHASQGNPYIVWQVPDTYAGDSSKTYTLS